MNQIKRPVNEHKAYHAHVYFDSNTLDFATKLCQETGEKFNLKVGRVHEKPVGPHPVWSCQILFTDKDFDTLIPWLESKRQDLTVFVHGLTCDNLKDHTDYAYWLGDSVALNLSMFMETT